MNGSRRLSLLTALTLAGLMTGATVLGVAANEQSDRGRGWGQQAAQDDDGNRGQAIREAVHAAQEAQDETELALVTSPGNVTGPAEREEGERPGWGCGDKNHEHLGPPGNPDAESPCDNGNDGNDESESESEDDD